MTTANTIAAAATLAAIAADKPAPVVPANLSRRTIRQFNTTTVRGMQKLEAMAGSPDAVAVVVFCRPAGGDDAISRVIAVAPSTSADVDVIAAKYRANHVRAHVISVVDALAMIAEQ